MFVAAAAQAVKLRRDRLKNAIQAHRNKTVDPGSPDISKSPRISAAGRKGACEPKPRGFFKYQPQVHWFYSHQRTQIVVALFISANFLTNVVEKQMDPSGTVYTETFVTLEDFYNIVFLFELLANMYGNWLCGFWMSSWNIFDFVVVCVGVSSLSFFKAEFPDALRLLRILRALRVFRLFKRIKSLNKIISALAGAVPGTMNAFVVLFLFLTIFSILGVEFFLDFGNGGVKKFENCSYPSLHRPYKANWRMNVSDFDDPMISAMRGDRQIDVDAYSMSSWAEFDAAQLAIDPEGYWKRKQANDLEVSALTMRKICFGEE